MKGHNETVTWMLERMEKIDAKKIAAKQDQWKKIVRQGNVRP